MKINNVTNHQNLNIQKNSPPKKESTKAEASDSINISSKARELADKAKNVAEIKQKINDGFYNQDSVIDKTAQAILNELKND